MKLNRLLTVMLLGLLLPFFSCTEKNVTGVIQTVSKEDTSEKFDPFIEGNKNIIRKEDEEIDLFIHRYQWEMTNTGSGLRIQVLKQGSGELLREGDTVSLSYQIFLLDGTMLYSSKNDGQKKFVVARSHEMIGLHEAVQQLKRGAEARIVLPSHLAYGVAGDGNKVKGRKSIAMVIQISK